MLFCINMHTCKRPMISLFVIWMREVSSTAKAGKLITLSRDELHSWKKNKVKHICFFLNPLSANLTKWSNTLKQFVGCCQRIVSAFDHFVGLPLKWLKNCKRICFHKYYQEKTYTFEFDSLGNMECKTA